MMRNEFDEQHGWMLAWFWLEDESQIRVMAHGYDGRVRREEAIPVRPGESYLGVPYEALRAKRKGVLIKKANQAQAVILHAEPAAELKRG